MNILTLEKDGFQPLFFDYAPAEDDKRTFCKVTHDGSHLVATPLHPKRKDTANYYPRSKDERRELFNELYRIAQQDGKTKEETQAFLHDNLCGYFDDENKLNAFIEENTSRYLKNQYKRLKRAFKKAHFNNFNYFVTFTYADSKLTEDEFKKKLSKCLSNLAYRHGWKYMGVWERGGENNRLHFHALMHIPKGELVGELTEKKDYSIKEHCMQTRHENTFFADRFGRNDFEKISSKTSDKNRCVNYILKYMQKTGERIVYSRGLYECFYTYIDLKEDAITDIARAYVEKYVLFDGVFERERERGNYMTERPRGYEPRYVWA